MEFQSAMERKLHNLFASAIPSLMPEKFKGKKTEKAGVVVEEEHLLSFIDVCDNNVILDTGASMMYMQVDIQ
jgi:hypothetical protein